MPRTVTIEEVKTKFVERGWQCLDEEFQGSQVKMNAICDKGHSTLITWNRFQQGQGCWECSGRKPYAYEDVKKTFTDAGYTLVDTEYKNSEQKLRYICPEGHEATVRYRDFVKGVRCAKCAANKVRVNALTEEEASEFCRQHGFALVKLWRNKASWLTYRCQAGHETDRSWNNFQKHTTCPQCVSFKHDYSEKVSQSLRVDREEIEAVCTAAGCTLLDVFMWNKGRGRATAIKYRCKCGNEAQAYLSNFRRYPNCWNCGREKKRGERCYMWNPDREQVRKNEVMQKRCYNICQRTLKAFLMNKTEVKSKILGYTVQDLHDRIFSFKDFDFTQENWHIDHIFPVKAFVDHDILDLKIINHLDNLRPLAGKQNLSKANKYDEEEFMEWLRLVSGHILL